MNLCLIGHDFRYELEKLIRIFFPFEKIEFFNEENISPSCAVTCLSEKNGTVTAEARLYLFDKIFVKTADVSDKAKDIKKEQELKLAQCLFNCFTQASSYEPQWGILTGVRPAKLFSRLCKERGEKEAESYFEKDLYVNNKKISLCKEAICGEDKITSLSRPDSFSLYISVPFCPSRCSYCSFVSHSVEQAKGLIPKYVEFLCREIELTAEIARKLSLRLETVYMGGGTPTVLSATELTQVIKTIKNFFDMTHLREFTVEAGRPDTITEEKLLAIKNSGATRISINPQTMSNSVLEAVGRKHTAEQTVDAFNLARALGFSNINMDLIAGLPTDTFDGFCESLRKVLELDPESVTVHALSMKRSSNLTIEGKFPEIEIGKISSKMVDFAHDTLSENGIFPYYMYRQSKTVGNLENVGYSKKGYECLYNVYIMDETHTILACGASAVTKLKEPGGTFIDRIFNYKYPYEYIDRFEELILRKDGIIKFYDKFISRN